MTPVDLDAAVLGLMGLEVRTKRRLHGGDISDVFSLTLADGTDVVAKIGVRVAQEARMLHAIKDAGAPAPTVLGLQDKLLLIEYIPEGKTTGAGWSSLGAGLRRLHSRRGDNGYGWPENYAFGTVAIPNTHLPNWPEFWAERRLLAETDALPFSIVKRLERVCQNLRDMLPLHPVPALLHGDLWTGNALFDQKGQAFLIDPACYFGDAEVDLAMLHLFGSPPSEFWEGYGRPHDDWQSRLPLYQLWPALVHLRLFGSTYLDMVTSRLDRLGY